MSRAPIASILSLAALCLAAIPARGEKLKDLVQRADMVLRGQTSAGVFTMEIKTASFERSFKIVLWDDSREKDRERSLIKILGPALWRGHGTLKVGSQLKIYNPRSDHVTVVGSSMLGDSWMGSHFTNDDLVKETRLDRHYNQALDSTWKGKDEAGQEVTFHRVSLTPKPTAPVAWGRIVYTLWERGGLVIPTRAEYLRKASDKEPARVMTFSQVKTLGGRTVPSKMTVTMARKPGEHTTVIYQTIKFDIALPEGKFTEQSLRK